VVFWVELDSVLPDCLTAFRTGAILKNAAAESLDFYLRDIHQSGSLFDHAHHLGLVDPVIEITALAARADQTRVTQHHQMLRDRCLAHPQASHHMADTDFLCPDRQEDLDAGRLTNDLEKPGELVFRG